MCGIAGAFGFARRPEARATAVARMTSALRHRGPDDGGGCRLLDAAGRDAGTFGHRRLSILDLSAHGHQPMTAASERFVIVYNGEIYNFRALRDELAREGATFRSDSDTEVLLEGWARHGERFLPRLRGMFAFALWDGATDRGFLVRDRFGIKPLYLAEVAAGVLFASEVRPIVQSGLVPDQIDPRAVAAYLSSGSVQDPMTMIRGVRGLPAGSVTEVRVLDGRVDVSAPRRFAGSIAAPVEPPERDPARASELLRGALRDSVAHHLVSDVPVAFFLSGGLDSSALVALASEASAETVATFTITFEDRRYSEAGPAAAVAKRFGTRHHQIPLSGAELLGMLPGALAAMDQPSMDGLNTFAVSSAVRRAGHKVVLSGLGGDELFGGYPSFRRARRLAASWGATSLLRRAAGTAARAVGGRADKLATLLLGREPAVAAYRASRSLFSDASVRALTGGAFDSARPEEEEPPEELTLLQRVSWYELTGYMRNTLLRDSDVFSMAHGLELRVPFVDGGVAEAAMAIDDALKLDRRHAKPLLVGAFRDLLPPEVWDRPKQGFELPFARWIREELRGEVESALCTAERVEAVGLSAGAARRVWQSFLAGRGGMTWSRPWSLYTLVRWRENMDAGAASGEWAAVDAEIAGAVER